MTPAFREYMSKYLKLRRTVFSINAKENTFTEQFQLQCISVFLDQQKVLIYFSLQRQKTCARH